MDGGLGGGRVAWKTSPLTPSPSPRNTGARGAKKSNRSAHASVPFRTDLILILAPFSPSTLGEKGWG